MPVNSIHFSYDEDNATANTHLFAGNTPPTRHDYPFLANNDVNSSSSLPRANTRIKRLHHEKQRWKFTGIDRMDSKGDRRIGTLSIATDWCA